VRNIKTLLTKAQVQRFYDPASRQSSSATPAPLAWELSCFRTTSRAPTPLTRSLTQRLDTLSLRRSCWPFEYFIYSKKPIVHTTQRPLPSSGHFSEAHFINNAASSTYVDTINVFYLEMRYKTGKTMYAANVLSRACLPFVPNTPDIAWHVTMTSPIHSLLFAGTSTRLAGK
jgi:hypothetical protein